MDNSIELAKIANHLERIAHALESIAKQSDEDFQTPDALARLAKAHQPDSPAQPGESSKVSAATPGISYP